MEAINTLVNFVSNNFPENGIMVEVGCYDGITTKHYINNIKNKNGKLHVVDWFKGCEMEPDFQYHGYRPTEDDLVLEKFNNTIKETGCQNIVTIHRGISWELAKDFEDKSLDICFIDASHIYKDVKRDIEAYLPKVKIGGYLMGHDFDGWHLLGQAQGDDLDYQCRPLGHFGVTYALADFFKQEEIQSIGDSVWVYHKK